MKIEVISAGNDENIQIIESKFSISLPNDYKNFIQTNDGARIIDGYFWIEELNQKALMGIFYGVSVTRSINIIDINTEYFEDIPQNSILIGRDAGGAFILLLNDNINNGIYFYDHSYFFEESSDSKNTYLIAKSFDDFIKILEQTQPD
ncbi:SMI1/KNR4 family protein [Flavobacterium ginsengiterrae]|uniref:Knr4/Smi1-like domain-containing protein n=1 Tax=Flavobacterium ginsengiterrae TaxID=871695 RepID=A0ABP7G964_9FLAO